MEEAGHDHVVAPVVITYPARRSFSTWWVGRLVARSQLAWRFSQNSGVVPSAWDSNHTSRPGSGYLNRPEPAPAGFELLPVHPSTRRRPRETSRPRIPRFQVSADSTALPTIAKPQAAAHRAAV
jgi:hypothetical protein